VKYGAAPGSCGCDRSADFGSGSFRHVEDTPFYVGAAQYQYLAETPLVLDVAPGGEDSFSLEAAEGIRFVARSLNPPSEK
jgi:uncharacterized protein